MKKVNKSWSGKVCECVSCIELFLLIVVFVLGYLCSIIEVCCLFVCLEGLFVR